MRYYKRIGSGGETTTVESYSHDGEVPGAIEINQSEFDDFMASLPPSLPPVDWAAEWKKAKSMNEQINLLARRLGMV
jgi:hypothetical protein